MDIFNCLSEKERDFIEKYISCYGPINEDFYVNQMKSLDEILKEWSINKSQHLFQLFGGDKLVVSRPYSYLSQPEALSFQIEQHDKDKAFQMFRNWYTWDVAHNPHCNIFITDMHGEDLTKKNIYYYSKWAPINECLTPLTLATNAYMGEDCIVHFPNSEKTMKLFKGMKPMKILHRIVQEYNGDEEIFEAFRTWHSMQLNQKRMDGELCLSIHPLDFMTMSDNANGWKSCMRWGCWNDKDNYLEMGHGDYCSGTVQCMNSPYIVVAYLHNPEHTFTPFYDDNNYVWNSKQWRELFIVQDGIINEIKGYPFQDENLTNTCLMWIKELAAKNLGWTYENEEINVADVIDDNIILTYNSGTFMYKDIGTLNKHSGRINRKVLLDRKHSVVNNRHFIDIEYGGEATCVSCGEPLDPEYSDKLMCECCNPCKYCVWCGEPIGANDDEYYVSDYDGPLCYNCFEDHAITDSFTDEVHVDENMTPIRLLLGYDKFKNPIYYDDTAYAYRPEDNDGLYTLVNEVHKDKDNYYCYYVSVNDAKDMSKLKSLLYAFSISIGDFKNSVDVFNAEMAHDYDVVYDYNLNPINYQEVMKNALIDHSPSTIATIPHSDTNKQNDMKNIVA